MQPLWRFLKILKIEIPYDSIIPLLGIYSKKTKTLNKVMKQPKSPSVDKCIRRCDIYIHTHIKTHTYIYKMEYYPGIRKDSYHS